LSTTAIARRYAKALYELAAEDGSVDAVGADLVILTEAVREIATDALQPGSLTAEVRRRIADKIAESVGRESLLARFVRVLADNDRLAELPAVCDWFARIRDLAAGRVRAAVTAATALSAADLQRLTSVLSGLVGKQVVPEVAIDEALIAGIVVEVEGRVFDGSVRTSLQRLSERMAGVSGKPTT
jgi:F-type H+-transporting ATPase subunit delta